MFGGGVAWLRVPESSLLHRIATVVTPTGFFVQKLSINALPLVALLRCVSLERWLVTQWAIVDSREGEWVVDKRR